MAAGALAHDKEQEMNQDSFVMLVGMANAKKDLFLFLGYFTEIPVVPPGKG